MLPIYFEAIQHSSPLRAGVQFFPTTFFVAPFAIIAGIIMTTTGTYKAMTIVAFAFISTGVGLFALLTPTSPTGYWIGFQLLFASGAGVLYSATLPAIQAALKSQQVASATATFSFFRNFGAVFGLAIPTAIFNSRIDNLSRDFPEAIQALLRHGGAYGLASSPLLRNLGQEMLPVQWLYAHALRTSFLTLTGFALLGFFVAFGYESIELRTVNETEYGIKRVIVADEEKI